jgi:hypothetical protein
MNSQEIDCAVACVKYFGFKYLTHDVENGREIFVATLHTMKPNRHEEENQYTTWINEDGVWLDVDDSFPLYKYADKTGAKMVSLEDLLFENGVDGLLKQ